MLKRSKGGNASQSSWYEPALENEAFRERLSGLGGDDDASGVLILSNGEPPFVDDVDEPFVETLAMVGERLSLELRPSGFGLSVTSDSDNIATSRAGNVYQRLQQVAQSSRRVIR